LDENIFPNRHIDPRVFQFGLHNTYLRQKLIKCAEDYQTKQELLAAKLGSDVTGDAGATPTAPPTVRELSTAPSAPPMEPAVQTIETFQSSECVVCLEMKVRSDVTSIETFFLSPNLSGLAYIMR
jgi:hypothetical protein